MSDELYRQTQNRIYSMQETLLNSSRESRTAVAAVTAADETENTTSPEVSTLSAVSGRKGAEGQKGGHSGVEVSSKSVLEYTAKNYAQQRCNLGTLEYDPMRVGRFAQDKPSTESLPFPYNFKSISSPRPFIPRLSHDQINSICTIMVDYTYLRQVERGENIRYQNREIWGTDIYTDDSDIILALQHCGVLSGQHPPGSRRTPANLSNPDSVKGAIPERDIPFAIKVDVLLLPPLQSYASTTRYDITSREWSAQVHDGLSFGIFHIEILVMDDTLNNIDHAARARHLQW